jgi:Golgi phosphoprotein 3 (GPP34)
MLSLAEEATLLMYGAVTRPDGTRTYDVFSRFATSNLLVAGAVFMDLAVRGRVRMDPPRSPEERARGRRSKRAGQLVAIAVIFGFPVGILTLLNVLHLFTFGIPIAVLNILPFIVSSVAVLVFVPISRWRADKMAIVDRSPTGDELLDSTLTDMALVGQRAPIRAYLRRHVRMRAFAAELAKLRAGLEARGLVSNADRGPRLFGLVEVKVVQRDHPDFRTLGERIRMVVLGGSIPDPRTMALVCLFAHEPRALVLGRGGTSLTGLYQFFHREEYSAVKTRMAQMRSGSDPALTAQLGNDLYDTLLAISYALQDLRTEESSSG